MKKILFWALSLLIGNVCYAEDITISYNVVLTFHTHKTLFLCSIQLITIPLAAFTKGRINEAAVDFVAVFGLLGAVLGTYGAGQNYAADPVLSFDNVVSGVTHAISGFAALYVFISGLTSMKKKNMTASGPAPRSST